MVWDDVAFTMHCILRRNGLTCPHLRRVVVERMRNHLWRIIARDDEFEPMLSDGFVRMRTADALFQRLPPMLSSGHGERENMVISRGYFDNVDVFLQQSPFNRCLYDIVTLKKRRGDTQYWYMPYYWRSVTSATSDDYGHVVMTILCESDFSSHYHILDDDENVQSACLQINGLSIDDFIYDARRRHWTLPSFTLPLAPLPDTVMSTGFDVKVHIMCRRAVTVRRCCHIVDTFLFSSLRNLATVRVPLSRNRTACFSNGRLREVVKSTPTNSLNEPVY